MSVGFDPNLLLSIYQTRSGAGTGNIATALGPTKRVAPTAPWSKGELPVAEVNAAVRSVLLGQKFIKENGAKLDLPGASQDYRKLFSLYAGLNTLDAVAQQWSAKGTTDADKRRLEAAFARGMAEVAEFIPQADLEKIRLIQGEAASTVKTTAPITKNKTQYVTPTLVTGSSATVVPAFQGAVKFDINVKRSGATVNVPIDLAGMGAQPRSLANVVNYINTQLQAAGVDVRVATERTAGGPKTTTVNGKTVTIGTNPDSYAMKVKVQAGETVSFAASATAGAVYVAQNVGNPDPDKNPLTDDDATQRQLLKFQTETTAGVPAPLQPEGEANWVDGRIFAKTLGPEVTTVRATKIGSDGSVYMLADIDGKTAGQEIRGEQDVALLKYDSAGKLIYARTLGAAGEASGLGLAVSADGKVALAGSVSGSLTGSVDGPLNSGATSTADDSFVTLYDADGQELWTERRGARLDDEASQVSFGADGTVYVAGRSKSTLPGASAIGGWDSYLEAFRTDSLGKPQTLFTQSFGTTATDKPAGLVVDGTNIVTASVENGRAILRRFDVSGATPVLTSTRDLGDLKGGDIAGLALDAGEVVIAGSTSNGALNAGTVTKGLTAGTDAFVARMSADLSGGGQIAYYGGTGNDKATSLSVAAGQVWIGGQAGDGVVEGKAQVGTQDGFVARIDVGAGAVAFTQRFTGKDGRAAPTAIAVDVSGASVLDRLGLPKGELDLADTPRITDLTALRPGDTFTVKSSLGRRTTVTIEAKDTIDTLAQKIRRATGFTAKVTIGTAEGNRKLTIAPLNERTVVEFGPGKADKDALAVLGIPEGAVRVTKFEDGKTVAGDGKPNLYGLALDSKLKLGTAEDLNHARADLQTAMGVIRTAYKDLVAAASPRSAAQEAAKKASGPVPAYLTNQIANYQAALNRLTGG